MDSVSIVLPTRNGAETLPAILDALWAQRITGQMEIIAVDSGSTDGTLDLLAARVHTLLQVPSREFNHGLTRNLGIAQARHEWVVLLVQDALPVSDGWIEAITRPLRHDATLAGVFARQQPRPDASAITRHYLRTWIASAEAGWTSRLPGGLAEWTALAPTERLRRCVFDNVASCVRRSVWLNHPLPATSMAEDLQWAREVLLAGYSLAFVPDAVVLHSHERSARYEFERTRMLHERLWGLCGLTTLPTPGSLARAVLSSLLLHARLEWREPGRWPRAAALALAWPLGQFLGARRAAAGRYCRAQANRV
jgi:rhamnosyltransferase